RLDRRRVDDALPQLQGPFDGELGDDRLAGAGRRGDQHGLTLVKLVDGFLLKGIKRIGRCCLKLLRQRGGGYNQVVGNLFALFIFLIFYQNGSNALTAWRWCNLVQGEDPRTRIVAHGYDGGLVVTQATLNVTGCAVSETKPDDLRRKTTDDAEVAEIGILGDNSIGMRLGIGPHVVVGRLLKTEVRDMGSVGEQVRQPVR